MNGPGARRPTFSTGEYERRLVRTRQEMAERRLDAVVIGSPENIYYLTGYQTLGYFAYQTLVVPLDAEPCLVVRYGERSNVLERSWLQSMETYSDGEDPVAVTTRVLQRAKAGRIGVEGRGWFLTPEAYNRLIVAVAGPAVEDCSGLVEAIRVTKSREELAYVEAAANVASVAMRAGIEAVAEGRTDRDVAAAVYGAAILIGGEYPPLPPLISAGPRTTRFHETWSGQRIDRGDVVFLEVPGVVARYLAPVARTVSAGTPPAYITERYKVALESLESGIAAMRPGITCGEVCEAFATPYRKAGYEIPIRVGYAVGINFPPRWVEWDGLDLLPGNRTVLEPGMVFHTPRSVRVYGDQTPIVSETTVVTETGYRVITDVPRSLVLR